VERAGVQAFVDGSIVEIVGFDLRFAVERRWDGLVSLLAVERRGDKWQPLWGAGRGGAGGHLRMWTKKQDVGARRPKKHDVVVDFKGGRGQWAQFEVLPVVAEMPSFADRENVLLRGVGSGAFLRLCGDALGGSADAPPKGIPVREVAVVAARAARTQREYWRAARNLRRLQREAVAFEARAYLEHRRLATAAYIMERRAASYGATVASTDAEVAAIRFGR
jgi:hypothetical protein